MKKIIDWIAKYVGMTLVGFIAAVVLYSFLVGRKIGTIETRLENLATKEELANKIGDNENNLRQEIEGLSIESIDNLNTLNSKINTIGILINSSIIPKINKITGEIIPFLELTAVNFTKNISYYIHKGDAYYAQFDDKKALYQYMRALKLDENNYEALWKISRSLINIGDIVNFKEGDSGNWEIKYYKDAEVYSRRAISVNPNDSWSHFYLSEAMRKYSPALGKKDQIQMLIVIKSEIEKAIVIDPQNDKAYHSLGLWHRRLAEFVGIKRLLGSILSGNIPTGSLEESEKYLKKAVELRPDYANHHLELGRTYVSMRKYELAVEEFQKSINLPQSSSMDYFYKAEAERELKEIKR